MSVNIFNKTDGSLTNVSGGGAPELENLHCDIGNVRIGEVEDTSLGKHTHLMGFTSNSKADPVIRYINYKEDGKSSQERLLLSYDSANADLLIKGNANDKYTEFRLSNYAKVTDVDYAYDNGFVSRNLFDGKYRNTILNMGENYTNNALTSNATTDSVVGLTYVTFGTWLKAGTYTFSYSNNAWFALNRIAIAGKDCEGAISLVRRSFTWTQSVDGYTYFSIEGDKSETDGTDTPFSMTPNIQIEKGSSATSYTSYAKSNAELTELADLSTRFLRGAFGTIDSANEKTSIESIIKNIKDNTNAWNDYGKNPFVFVSYETDNENPIVGEGAFFSKHELHFIITFLGKIYSGYVSTNTTRIYKATTTLLA